MNRIDLQEIILQLKNRKFKCHKCNRKVHQRVFETYCCNFPVSCGFEIRLNSSYRANGISITADQYKIHWDIFTFEPERGILFTIYKTFNNEIILQIEKSEVPGIGTSMDELNKLLMLI